MYGPYQMCVLLFAYAISEPMYFNEDGKPHLKWHQQSRSLISVRRFKGQKWKFTIGTFTNMYKCFKSYHRIFTLYAALKFVSLDDPVVVCILINFYLPVGLLYVFQIKLLVSWLHFADLLCVVGFILVR